MTPRQEIVLSSQSNQVRIRFRGDRATIDWVPRWLCALLDIEQRFPFDLTPSDMGSHSLSCLILCASEIAESGQPVQDAALQCRTREGDEVQLLVSGHPEASESGKQIVLTVTDATELLRERRKAAAIGRFHGLVGESLPMLEVFHRIALYGPLDAPVVITGETGTGKELVARAVHERSPRSSMPFIPVNCTALTPELFESELFGHEKGSFTGAYRQHRGRFERADKGTLFLDEIGDMPPMTQAKMLRALEEGVIERVGSEDIREVDVRVIAATNVALEQAVAMRRFRADLYHRLNVFRIHLPPLRERTGDMPLLVDHILQTLNRRYNRIVKRLTPEAMRILEDYSWPGNIRELRNVLERIHVETTGEAIGAKSLTRWLSERDFHLPGNWNVDEAFRPRAPIVPPGFQPTSDFPMPSYSDRQELIKAPVIRTSDTPTLSWQDSLPVAVPFEEINEPDHAPPAELTAETIRAAYADSDGNLTQAARLLGVHKATLYRHLKRLGLDRETLSSAPFQGTD